MSSQAQMELDVVKQFSLELASLYESKPPISKAKMVQITKVAIKSIKYYKHIVMAVEKFIHRCKPEYKLPGLYVIDSIVRQSRHQFGSDKDVFAPRFAKNLLITFQGLGQCIDDDKPKILRVLNLWLQNNVFTEDILRPVVEFADNFAIGVETKTEENKFVASEKSSKRSQMLSSPSDFKHSPLTQVESNKQPVVQTTPQRAGNERINQTQKTPQTMTTVSSGSRHDSAAANIDPNILQQIQRLTSSLITSQPNASESEKSLTKRILAGYDYSDEEEESGDDDSSEKGKDAPRDDITATISAAAQNLLNNPQLLQQIQQMQHSMRNPPAAPAAVAAPNKLPAPPQPPPPSASSQHQSAPPQRAAPTSALGTNQQHHQIPPVPTNIGFPARFPANFSIPPPNYSMPPPAVVVEPHPQPPVISRTVDSQAHNYPPPAEPLPPGFDSHRQDTDERKRHRRSSGGEGGSSKKHKSRDRSRSKSKSRDKKRKKKSRSRSGSRGKHSSRRHRSKSKERRDKEKERERRGLPSTKSKHISICTRTLWFGRVPMYCEQDEIKEALKEYGEPVSIDLIPPRGCAYIVMPDRKSAYKILTKLKDLKIQNRSIKMAWAPGKGVKNTHDEGWDVENGVTYISYDRLPGDLTQLLDGGILDVDSLPENLKSTYTETGRVGAQMPAPVVAASLQTTAIVVPPAIVAAPTVTPFSAYVGMPPGVYPAGVAGQPYPPPPMVPPGAQQMHHRHPLPQQPGVLHAVGTSMAAPPIGLTTPNGIQHHHPHHPPPPFGMRPPPSLMSMPPPPPPLMPPQQHPPDRYGGGGQQFGGRGFRGRGGGGPRFGGGGFNNNQPPRHRNWEDYEPQPPFYRNRGGGGGGFGGRGRGGGFYSREDERLSRSYDEYDEEMEQRHHGDEWPEERESRRRDEPARTDPDRQDEPTSSSSSSRRDGGDRRDEQQHSQRSSNRRSRWADEKEERDEPARTTAAAEEKRERDDEHDMSIDESTVSPKAQEKSKTVEENPPIDRQPRDDDMCNKSRSTDQDEPSEPKRQDDDANQQEDTSQEKQKVVVNRSMSREEFPDRRASRKEFVECDERPQKEESSTEASEPAAPPPETVTEEHEVEEDNERYDQRGLGFLLKMMSKPE